MLLPEVLKYSANNLCCPDREFLELRYRNTLPSLDVFTSDQTPFAFATPDYFYLINEKYIGLNDECINVIFTRAQFFFHNQAWPFDDAIRENIYLSADRKEEITFYRLNFKVRFISAVAAADLITNILSEFLIKYPNNQKIRKKRSLKI